MSLIVQKFGGSSVKDAERIKNVAGIIADTYRAGNDVIVVLSAQGDTTDDLIEKAKSARSAEELLEIAKANNTELTEEEAAAYMDCCGNTMNLGHNDLEKLIKIG